MLSRHMCLSEQWLGGRAKSKLSIQQKYAYRCVYMCVFYKYRKREKEEELTLVAHQRGGNDRSGSNQVPLVIVRL